MQTRYPNGEIRTLDRQEIRTEPRNLNSRQTTDKRSELNGEIEITLDRQEIRMAKFEMALDKQVNL